MGKDYAPHSPFESAILLEESSSAAMLRLQFAYLGRLNLKTARNARELREDWIGAKLVHSNLMAKRSALFRANVHNILTPR